MPAISKTGYIVYGTTGQNRPMVEGIAATEGTGAAGFYYDYGAVEEVSVGTAPHSAEMPWPGVQSQFISKSGGNTYHGMFYGDYQNESIQALPIRLRAGRRVAAGSNQRTSTDSARITTSTRMPAGI